MERTAMSELTLMEQAQLVVGNRLDKLESEGSADAIALALEGQMIRAHCGEPSLCAVALYLTLALNDELGLDHGLEIEVAASDRIGILETDAYNQVTDRVHVVYDKDGDDVEHVINQFIIKFDQKKYPNLISSEEI